MKTIRVLHPCRPTYDNLGEIAANEAIAPMFHRRGVAVELVDTEAWSQPADGCSLDGRIDEINSCYDLLMIGPAGFLGPRMIEALFSVPSSWQRLTTPLCFNGVGIVASVTRPVWYGAMDMETHVMQALRKASVVSTRELNSWLLASRALGGDTGRLMLTGCPSIRLAHCSPLVQKTHDLALNLSFHHEVCRQYIPVLLQIAKAVQTQKRRVLWVCHSRLDEIQATGVNRELRLGFDILRPRSAAQAGAAYAACDCALVTRFHAGAFCVANAVPFGFIGYDVKCWHLISMFADEPYQYVLPIDRLTCGDADRQIGQLFGRLEKNAQHLRKAQRLLLAYFAAQTDRFADAVIAAVHAHRPSCDASALLLENATDKMSG